MAADQNNPQNDIWRDDIVLKDIMGERKDLDPDNEFSSLLEEPNEEILDDISNILRERGISPEQITELPEEAESTDEEDTTRDSPQFDFDNIKPYTERIAREEATREVETKLNDVEFLQEETGIPSYVEVKIERALSDEDYMTNQTTMGEFVEKRATEEVENTLSDGSFLMESTAIPRLLSTEYSLEAGTIQGLWSRIDEFDSFMDQILSFHESRVTARERWQNIESVVAILFGMTVVFTTAGYYDLIMQSLPRIINLVIFVLLLLMGIGLSIAGFNDFREKGDKDGS